MPGHDIIVIGASAGGVQALAEVVEGLPEDLPAAVFTTIHLGAGRSALPEILTRSGRLPAGHPVHGEPIRRGRIYVAPPDRHLQVGSGHLLVARGPRENGTRPAIDVLFRSAAQTYGPRVVGVVLTGNLDDGTAGLLEVKARGGITVVQDPAEADYPGMPQNALQSVPVDYVAPLAEIGALLARLAREPAAESAHPVAGTGELLGESGEDFGKPSGFTCPDCGGGLWEWQEGELTRYRCRTGHAFSPESLAAEQEGALDTALWVALRALEENADLSRRMANRMRDRGLATAVERYLARVDEAERHAEVLRALLQGQSVA
jgi:two-component system, chemotaxis family, protein-glutamate methylesterase/glutaminase